eukprot:TRINITY_DN83777_c0_g1_i1.p1 TRINITY_DN83777_c0_g1~~TRINITY_DN83777_c0_g1_i1.p1  ORF type:complete len:100 (+),score=0.48 TRINITY_DN83777_c0_g1_i1:120-419(+)
MMLLAKLYPELCCYLVISPHHYLLHGTLRFFVTSFSATVQSSLKCDHIIGRLDLFWTQGLVILYDGIPPDERPGSKAINRIKWLCQLIVPLTQANMSRA